MSGAWRRRLVFAVLYATEGAPIGFLWWALPTILKGERESNERIGALLSLLVLPWALKFLWAPLVDTLRGPRWGFRAWIASSQGVMALSLLPLVWIGPSGAFPLLAAVLIVHALAAATQDVAIDALAIRASAESERGALNGWMQAGMLSGRSAFGGGALVARERVGDDVVILALVAALLGGALFTLLAPLPREGEGRAARRGELSALLGRALRKRATWAGLGFAVLAGAGFEGLGAFVGPFLKDRGWSDAAVGTFVGLPAVGAMLLGGLVGGACADRIGHRRTVASSLLFVACGVWALAASGDATAVTLVCLLVVDLGLGALVASSYALFMDLTDPALGGTQFSAFMGATNLCEAWSVAAAGRLSTRLGYAPAFSILAAVSLAALPLLKSGDTDARDGSPRDHEEP